MKARAMSLLFLVCLCLSTVGLPTGGSLPLERLDPALRMVVTDRLADPAPSAPLRASLDPDRYEIRVSPDTGEERIGVLVQMSKRITSESVGGLPVLGSFGTVLAMEVNVEELIGLLEREDLVYVEPSWKTRPQLDVSVPAIGARAVHGLIPAVTGKGVVVGAVDTGIDYMHLDFRYDGNGDGFEESSRIHSIWDQTFGLFGMKFSNDEIEGDIASGSGSDAGSVRQADVDGHGTHVMGIAAGDGSSSADGFVGVAPEASLVMVKTTFYTSDILRGVGYIFEVAGSLGLPAVVNLSLGGHDGPHDGTSLFEQGLDDLAQGPGRAIVVSAGNEGNQAVHASATLSGRSVSYRIEPKETHVDLCVWYPGGSRFTVAVEPPGGPAVVAPWGTETGPLPVEAGTVRIDNAWLGPNPNNGDNKALIRMYDMKTLSGWEITISDVQGGGRFDMWVTSATATIEGGDSVRTIDEPGNAARVITVGAYTTKSRWPSQSGDQDYAAQYPVGALAAFSSRGPTRDGRVKPEIAAPGAWICATLSEDAGWFAPFVHPDGVHTMELGTSMAAPHVTGTIALLFSVDPTLSGLDVRDLLTSNAVRDGQTGSVPNTTWGWGKLAALAAVEEALASGPQPPPPTETPTVEAIANPVSTAAKFVYSVPNGATSARLRIYDVSGAPVYEVVVDPAGGSISWPLRTARGLPVASGLYLYVLVTDLGSSPVGRLVVAR